MMGEIEERSTIYIKQIKEYCDCNVKEKMWTEVYIQVIPEAKERSHK